MTELTTTKTQIYYLVTITDFIYYKSCCMLIKEKYETFCREVKHHELVLSHSKVRCRVYISIFKRNCTLYKCNIISHGYKTMCSVF